MGCGTWAWGNRLIWDYEPTMDTELRRVFDYCVAHGVTFFDSGDSYGTGRLNGRSEQLLGQFARDYERSHAIAANGDRICLATKLAAYPWRLTRQSMVVAGRKSAQRMGRPPDLVQLHWSPRNYAPWQEGALLDGLADLVEAGEVKGVGLSNYGPKALRRVSDRLGDRGIPILCLQVQYSLLSTYPERELDLFALCRELRIQPIAYSPLALGLLSGKYGGDRPLPKGLRGILFRQLLAGIEPLLDCLREIALQRQVTPAQVALNWCMSKGTMPIPGAKTLAQARDNIGALAWRLDSGELDSLDLIASRTPRQMVQNIFQTR